jgi:rhodanese-related sulfurtransferase
MKADLLRLALLTGGASLLGLAVNAGRQSPIPLMAVDGPGALPARAERITVEEWRRAMDQGRPWLLLDVRRAEAFQAEHAPWALSVPATSFVEAYQRLNLGSALKAAERVVVLCESASCPAGDRAAKTLAELGHAETRVLQGGWESYVKAGLPRVKR